MTSEEFDEWLKNLQVGDKVAYVTRLTKNLVVATITEIKPDGVFCRDKLVFLSWDKILNPYLPFYTNRKWYPGLPK